MTVQTVTEIPEPYFIWVDVVNPSRDELADIARKYQLHPTSVNDCLDPEHLPKFETFDNYTFVILRAWDEAAAADCTTVQEVTRKLAIFYGPSFLLTIHRTEQRWLRALVDRVAAMVAEKRISRDGRESPTPYILTHMLNGVVDTYQAPMENVEAQLDAFEQKVFVERTLASGHFRRDLREIHLLKRQVTLIKRLLLRTVAVVQRMMPSVGRALPLYRDVHENVEGYHFYADELLDDANTLLNVQLSLASHRSGEVMRVLTLFSAFFLPLTFIVGIYGMNFDFMPELRERWGYPAVMAFMALITLGIYLWFKRRGWIRG
jgi:magnesium transporter